MAFKGKLLIGLILFFCFSCTTSAQHSVTLTFTKSTDDTGAAGSGYIAWRMNNICPTTAPTDTTGFTALNGTLFTTNTYVDNTVTPGQYCYIVTFNNGSAQSVPSNTAGTAVLPQAPTNVKIGAVN